MSRSLHIDLVTETYPPDVNGVALTVQSLERGLREHGHRVGLIRTGHKDDVEALDADVLVVPGAPMPSYPGVRFGLPAGRRLLARWTAQRPNAIYVATEGPLGWSAVNAARRLGIPVVTGFHTRFDNYAGRYGVGLLSPWVFAWLRRFHNRADLTLVPTLELQQQLRATGFLHVERLGRAVDTKQFHPGMRETALRESWGLVDEDVALISVGRLAAEKNLELTIAAYRAVRLRRPGTRLILVGDGPLRARLESENPDVIFAGVQRGDALSRHFASADLFLFSSMSETFGNVTLEAMASGLASVAFDYGAAREHLRHGEHGCAVPFGDEEEFVRAAVRLASDASLFRLGEAARQSVKCLHPADVARDFADLLLQLGEVQRAA
jgi:glycosyltransferase involved in cell wall biosynthesis